MDNEQEESTGVAEQDILNSTAPLFSLRLIGAPTNKWPFTSVLEMITVTDIIGDLYLGRRTRPYYLAPNVYRYLAKCSYHNRKLLNELRLRELILGCDKE